MRMMTALCLAVSLAVATPALGDEVEDTIAEALQAYQEQDFAGAKQALDYASQLLLQKTAASLAGVLPAPLPGWEAGDSETSAAAMGLFGGGIHATQTYLRGNETVEIQIVGDSPLLAQWIPMLSNPAMGLAMGAKRVKIGEQYGLHTQDGEVILIFDNRFLVTIGGTAPKESKVAYGEKIDVAALKAL